MNGSHFSKKKKKIMNGSLIRCIIHSLNIFQCGVYLVGSSIPCTKSRVRSIVIVLIPPYIK